MPDLVRFTETMRGFLAPLPGHAHEVAAAAGRRRRDEVVCILTVVTADVDRLVADPDHRSPAYGCVLAPVLHPAPLRVEHGHLDLFADADPTGRVLHMRYGLRLRDEAGRAYYLRGIKEVVRRSWLPTSLADTTTLYTDVWGGADPVGRPVLRGVLRMGPVGFLGQLSSFRGSGAVLGLRGIARYLAYYVARVARVYLGPRREPLRPAWARAGDEPALPRQPLP